MDKTININLGGTLFQIDQEAYRILRDYLQAINNRFKNVQGGHETIDDIEFRIAEIFQSQKGLAGVITKENIDSMISIIGKPEDFDSYEPDAESPVNTSYRKRMYRNPDDSIVSGVCGGIGAYLNSDPVIFRILFVLFTVFFGIGFFVYIALWIALPEAKTDVQKRELFGASYNSVKNSFNQSDNTYLSGAPYYNSGYNNSSRIGNAVNEIFRAISRVLFIIMRIFLVFVGVVLVLTGFLVILSLVLVLVFKFPGLFTADGHNMHMTYYRDFLNYIVNPSSAPWIIALTLMAIILPMLALVYAGVKMIFWFRAKDGIFGLAGLVLWVAIIVVLAVILFNEGISFAERGTATSQTILSAPPDTLYIIAGKETAPSKSFKEFSLPDDDYTMFMVDSTHQFYIPARLSLNISDNKMAKVEIKKHSSGPTRMDAERKAESIIYNYRVSNDTLCLDQYLTLPAGSKWSADFVHINLMVPENTVLFFDKSSEKLFHKDIVISKVENDIVTDSELDYYTEPSELGNRYWVITSKGLKNTDRPPSN
jgi:phage shock protein PspC (stress-responsive transcriptional regulator)